MLSQLTFRYEISSNQDCCDGPLICNVPSSWSNHTKFVVKPTAGLHSNLFFGHFGESFVNLLFTLLLDDQKDQEVGEGNINVETEVGEQ